MGASVWCAAGSLTVATPESASIRLGVPASAWWFVLAAAAALAIPGWRRRPWLAAPALIATLPWWPMSLPAALLLWTGPLVWLPIGLAVASGVLASRVDVAARLGAAATPDGAAIGVAPLRPAILAGALTLAAAVAAAAAVDTRTPGGDEPHYLVITQSLLRDGDLRIENNHRDRDYAEYYGGTIQPDFIQRGIDGEIYSIHAPGVPLLVAPGFAAIGYRGAQATLLLMSAMAGALLWLIGWHAAGRSDAAWFAWAAVTLTPAFLLQAGMIFPDAPGALAVAAGAYVLLRLTRDEGSISRSALATTGALLALLPWLHTRFAVLAGALGVLMIWRLWRNREDRAAALAAFLAVPAAAALGWLAFFWTIYGTFNPAAPYGADSGARLSYVPGGMLALLFDQQFGLLAYSPVLAAAVLGLTLARQSPERRAARALCAVSAVYTAAVATYWMWWAGIPATPARFLTAALPLTALPLGLTWAAASGGVRQALSVLLVVSVAITVITIGVDLGALAWNTRDARAQWLLWLGPVVDLPRAWPSFFWQLDPADLTTELPFVLHAALFAAVIVAGIGLPLVAAAGIRARRGWPAMQGIAWALPVAIMIAASAGWRLNEVEGLAPSRSQLAVAGLAGQGRMVWHIAPGLIGREGSPTRALQIRGREPGRTDAPPPWAVFVRVPPGRYELIAKPPVPAGRQLIVRLGQSATVLESMLLSGGGSARVPISLPAGARVLTVDQAAPASGEHAVIELHPTTFDRHAGPLAHTFARYGSVDVFFLDQQVFIEPAGFWVRGASAAEVIITHADAAPLALHVQNGGSPNAVELTINGASQTLDLQASETRQALVPAAAQGKPIHIRVVSPSGFRPADNGQSDDRRLLGVWIAIDSHDSTVAR